jgi:putative hydrolase of HD superfamily
VIGDEELVTSKNPFPAGIEERIRAQLTFIAEADRMKTVLRASPLASVERRENDAEHSWHLALMVLLLSEYAPEPIDVRRALELVIIHDLIEVYAGDSPVFDDDAVIDQIAREQAAADRLFGLLPEDQTKFVRDLWDEFEANESPEARFAKSMDRLEPMLLNWLAGGGTWQTPGCAKSTVQAREASVVDRGTTLGGVARLLVDEGLKHGWIRPDN